VEADVAKVSANSNAKVTLLPELEKAKKLKATADVSH
jgi:hypothetical protein